jgi:hypothetical protein
LSRREQEGGAPWLGLVGLAVVIALGLASLGGELAWTTAAAQSESGENQRVRLSEADGLVRDRASVFDEDTPAVARLDPDLLRALRSAATAAGNDGIVFAVNSGWRSMEYQGQLFREAVADHGSRQQAARWVATAATSPHVSGDAVDIGPSNALAWLSRHGARFGLCQIYANEPWHYELRPDSAGSGCPHMYADAAHDPRMQP